MSRYLSFYVLLLYCASHASAATVPYPSGLGGDLLPIATNIIEFEKVNSAKALAAAHVLFVKSTTESSDVKAWSLNVYVEFLLSNDSISKAEKLLVDSSLVNWNSVKPYLQDYKLLNQGRLFGFNGNYFAADTCFRTVMNRASNRVLSLQSIQALAQNLRFQGKLDQSSVRWYEAQKISEEISDSSSTMQAYLGLGTVWFLRDELEKARTNFELFYAYNERIGNEKGVAAALSLIGLVYYKTKDFELCIETNLEGYGIRKRIGDIKGQGESLNNLALGYMGMKNWNQGLQYLQEAVEIKTRANDLTQLTVILNNIGHCYSRLGKNELALKYFNLALAKGKENGQMRDVVNSYQNIIKLHRNASNFSDALDYQTTLMALKDSLAKEDKNQVVQELEVKYQTEQKEQEILVLTQDRAIVTNRWITLALGLFLAIIIGVLFIDSQKRKHRQEKLLLSAEDDLQKAELKNMASRLEFNQNKLSLYTENLLKKNDLVNQLEVRLKNAVDKGGAELDEGKQLMEDFSSVRILTDKDWVEFKSLFNTVHSGLLDRLVKTYENLTVGEQRLFLLMKLDLSTKEIANILGVSPESIKKGRYRLKKKIGLIEGKTLQQFVSEF